MFDLFARSIARRWRRAATIRRLQWLDDHLLADIGTSRDAIDDFVTALDLEEDNADQCARPVRTRQPADAGWRGYRHGVGADVAC